MAANPQPRPERKFTRLRGQYVSAEDLLLYQSDPKREEKLGWTSISASGLAFADTVVCRECGQILTSIATVHLRSHQPPLAGTQKGYRARWLDAPVLSPRAHVNVNKAALKYIAANRQKMRGKSADWRKLPGSKEKIKNQGKRATARRRTDPGPRRATDRKSYAKRKIHRATEGELELFLAYPSNLDYVVCLENLEDGSICRAKLRDIGPAHLPQIHKKTVEQYQEEHPGTPTKAGPKEGRRIGAGKRLDLFITATRSYDHLKATNPKIASYGLVAKKLTPTEYDKDQKSAADRLRQGANYVRENFPALFSL